MVYSTFHVQSYGNPKSPFPSSLSFSFHHQEVTSCSVEGLLHIQIYHLVAHYLVNLSISVCRNAENSGLGCILLVANRPVRNSRSIVWART